MRTPPPEQEQEDLELPPLDADDDGESDAIESHDDVALDVDDSDSLDDAAATDLDVGADPEIDESLTELRSADALDQDDLDAGGLDVGALDEGLVGGDDEEADDRDGGLPSDDDDDLSAMEAEGDDGGAEGTSDPIEDDVDDAALPELDADDAGDFEEEDVVVEPPSEDPDSPPWDAERWVVSEGAGAVVPCRHVVADEGRVVAAGTDGLLLVDEGTRAVRHPLPGGGAPVALAALGDRVVVATSGGRVLVVSTGREPIALRGGWDRGGVTGVVATPERLWIAADGCLWTAPLGEEISGGAPRLVKSGGLRSIAAAGGAVVALADVEGARAILRFRSDDEPWSTSVLEGAGLEAARGEPAILAAAGLRAIAVAGPRGIALSHDGGARFSSVALVGVRALAFVGDAEDAELLALVERDADEGAWLVRVSPGGAHTRLGELRASEFGDEPLGEAALAWDSARETAWVACRIGLVALAKRARH